MSGPLALALDRKYDAHLYGVIAELITNNPSKIRWRWIVEDIVTKKDDLLWLLQDGKFATHAGYFAMDDQLETACKDAWLRWYAASAAELADKEDESRFATSAAPLSRAIAILREHQRDDDPVRSDCSYDIPLHAAEKQIVAYFRRFYAHEPPEKPFLDPSERLENILSLPHGKTRRAGDRARLLFATLCKPEGLRVRAETVYARGWETRDCASLSWMSGLLALAIFNYEIQYYYAIGNIIRQLQPVLERGRPWQSMDKQVMNKFRRWWPPLIAITTLIGPASYSLYELVDEMAEPFGGDENVIGLRQALLEDTRTGRALRSVVSVPDDMAQEFKALRASSRLSYDIGSVPQPLGQLIETLRNGSFRYHPDAFRAEFLWWLSNTGSYLASCDSASPSNRR